MSDLYTEPESIDTVVERSDTTSRRNWKFFIARHRIGLSKAFFVCYAGLLLVSEPVAYSLYSPLRWWLLAVAFSCVVIAVLGRLWCSLYLCGYKNKQLVSVGPYSVVRNPLYIFSLFGAIGIGVASLSVTLTLIVVLFLVFVSVSTVDVEESNLASMLGDSYCSYKARTPRFIPTWRLYAGVPEYTIATRQMHSAFLDVIWFFIIFALVAVLQPLHISGMLPSLIRLP